MADPVRGYVRCCVVCLAERGVAREQEVEIRTLRDVYQVVLPVCERHRAASEEAFVAAVVYERAESARWITRGRVAR